jgi:hypothetical protein
MLGFSTLMAQSLQLIPYLSAYHSRSALPLAHLAQLRPTTAALFYGSTQLPHARPSMVGPRHPLAAARSPPDAL